MKKFRKSIFTLMTLLIGLSIMGFATCSTQAGARRGAMVPGQYMALAKGYFHNLNNQPITYGVVVTVSDRQIIDISTIGNLRDSHSQEFGVLAIPILRDKVLAHQTAGVDVITGSTISSMGFLLAVDEALGKAGAPARMRINSRPVFPPRAVTKDIDILVMGTGLSGLSAAIKAKTDAPDARVVLIDKSEITGGTSRMAAPVVWLPLNEADTDNYLEFFYRMARGDADRSILRAFADNALNAFNLIAGNSMTWHPAATFSTSLRMRSINMGPPGTIAGGNAFIDTLVSRAIAMGIPIMTGVRGYELIVDPANPARVIGARARSKTNISYTFNTSVGVILATGGHGWNASMIDKYHAGFHGDRPYNHPTHTGDGYRMGREIGARTLMKGGKIGTSAIYGSFPIVRQAVGVPIASDGELMRWGVGARAIPAEPPGYVNMFGYSPRNGQGLLPMFDGEDGGILEATTELIKRCQRMHRVFMITKRQEARFATPPLPYPTFYMLTRGNSVPRHPGNAIVYFGETPEQLVQAFPAAMRDTMRPGILRAFNNGYVPGVGSFFIAQRIHPSDIGTMGGLMIDPNARVLREGGVFIGLYAAGDLANGQLLYQAYVSGTGLAIAGTFGFLAGQHAAAQFNALP